MFEVKAREGDFVETYEGVIFDVKGLGASSGPDSRFHPLFS